jgi:hypothetical protein
MEMDVIVSVRLKITEDAHLPHLLNVEHWNVFNTVNDIHNTIFMDNAVVD